MSEDQHRSLMSVAGLELVEEWKKLGKKLGFNPFTVQYLPSPGNVGCHDMNQEKNLFWANESK